MVKKIISGLHLYLGLASAIVVFFVCITGVLIVYCDEVMGSVAGDDRFVTEVKENKLPVEKLVSNIKEKYPGRATPFYMVTYKDPHRSAKFITFEKDFGLRMVYIDPYKGSILKDDASIHFFFILAQLHSSLLLGETGRWIVSVATIILIVELLTGLVLWWPKKRNKKTIKTSLSVKWNKSRMRLFYDLHKVLGFYSLGIVMILSVTGLLIAFEPLSHAVMESFGAETSHDWDRSLPKFQSGKQPADFLKLLDREFDKNPNRSAAQVLTYNIDSTGYFIAIIGNNVGLKSVQNSEMKIFDRFSGDEVKNIEGIIKHGKVENAIWMLHAGNWMGQIGKFLTFIGGLIASSLPVTGFYLWWQKKRKNGKTGILIPG